MHARRRRGGNNSDREEEEKRLFGQAAKYGMIRLSKKMGSRTVQ